MGAMGFRRAALSAIFDLVVHRESRILFVVHRTRYMAVIRES
jgi:hypothetical protein